MLGNDGVGFGARHIVDVGNYRLLVSQRRGPVSTHKQTGQTRVRTTLRCLESAGQTRVSGRA